MGGLHRGLRYMMVLGIASTGAFAASTDDEPEFLSTGTTVPSPPPPPKPAPLKTLCPPSSKNEVCRCVFYGTDSVRFTVAKGLPELPKYCADRRLKEAIELDEGQYLQILFKIEAENGEPEHDG